MLLVIRNFVLLDQRDEILWGIARKRRLAEMRIGGEKILRVAREVGEVAAPTARDQDLLSDLLSPLQHHDAPAAFSGLDRAHQPGRSRAQHDRVKIMSHVGVESFLLRLRDAKTTALSCLCTAPAWPRTRKKKRPAPRWPLSAIEGE